LIAKVATAKTEAGKYATDNTYAVPAGSAFGASANYHMAGAKDAAGAAKALKTALDARDDAKAGSKWHLPSNRK
jgi:hypothetical protein